MYWVGPGNQLENRSGVALIGRRVEISRFRQALSVVDGGGGATVVVAGEPGMGKSRLLDHLATIAAEGRRTVLSGYATEFGRHEPFGVLADALDDAVEAALAADPGLLDEHTKKLLSPVLPALRRHNGQSGGPAAGDRAERYQELRRLLRLLSARDPIVLVLDDLHWIDQSSAEFLDHLLRHAVIPRLLVTLAYRPRPVPSLVASAVERARAIGRLELIELPPLSLQEAAELVTSTVPGRELATIYAASGGNPLYLEIAARRRVDTSADPALRALLLAEIPALSPHAVTLLQAAAVLGDPFDLPRAAAVAGLDGQTAGAALDEIAEQDLVRPTDSVRVFRFRHPLVRSAVYAQAKRAWLVAAHQRAVEELRAHGAGVVDIAHHVAQVAEHGDLEAVAVLEQAARQVVTRDPATAAQWLADVERLLPHTTDADPRRIRLLGELADALGRSGRLADSSRRLRDLIKLVPSDRLDLRVRYVCGSAESDHLAGRFDRARALLQEQLRVLSRDRPQERVALLVTLATGAYLRGALAEALGHARQATALVSSDCPPEWRLAALSTLAIAAVANGDLTVAAEAVAQAAILFASVDDAPAASQLVHLGELAWANYYLGWHDQALRVVRRAVELAQRTGHMSTLPYLLLCEAKTRQFAGRIHDALDSAGRAEEIARLNGSDDHLSMALAAKAEAVFWLEGSAGPATRLAVQAVAAAGWRTGMAGRKAVFVLTEIALTSGTPQHSARQLVSASGGPTLPAWPRTCRPKVFEMLTRAAVVARDIDQVRHWATSTENAATYPALGGSSYAKLARARLAGMLGEQRLAADLALTAADGFGNEGYLLEEGTARVVAARALVKLGADAAAEKRKIAMIARRCESVRLARMADRGNTTIRATDPRQDPYAPLSRREREVAGMLATGMTNREIANQLHVTIRTVDAHVSRILRKLHVPSRAAVVGLQLPGDTTATSVPSA